MRLTITVEKVKKSSGYCTQIIYNINVPVYREGDRERRFREALRSIEEGSLPEIYNILRLKVPDDVEEVVKAMWLDVEVLTSGNNSAKVDVYRILQVAVAVDRRDGCRDYTFTKKTWALLEAAKDNRGLNGLKQALTGLIECCDFMPTRLTTFVDEAYDKLKLAK